MRLIADLHLHSKYSRAVSKQMVIPEIVKWARLKGIDLVGAPDWTHPLWLRELKNDLIEVGEGVFAYREDLTGPKFLLVTEISSIYPQDGRSRRIHTLVFAPSFSVVDEICQKMRARGARLMSDGRPITGIPVRELAEIVFSVSPKALVIPSHLWTPWYGTLGDKGGFDSLGEAYGDLSSEIGAIETGMSSDPAMNWQIRELDDRSILSFSDAHSPPKIGREATVLINQNDKLNLKIDYQDVAEAIKQKADSNWKIGYTVEFYPEEGKYHYTGHRKCGVSQDPEETKNLGRTCPVCGRPLTIGVLHRVEKLAARSHQEVEGEEWEVGQGAKGRKWRNRPPYIKLLPLQEILAEVLEMGVTSQGVQNEYHHLVSELGSEFEVLIDASSKDVSQVSGEKIAEGIQKVREGNLVIEPGHDGIFGTVKIWGEKEEKPREQMSLF